MQKLLYLIILFLYSEQTGLAQIGNKTIKGTNNSIINGNNNIVNNTTIIQQTKTIYADKSFKKLTTLFTIDTAFSRKFRVFLQNPELLKDLINKEVERKEQILDKSQFVDLFSGYIAKNKQLSGELESARLEIKDSVIKSKFLKAEDKLSNFDNEGYQSGMDEIIHLEELKEKSIREKKALFYYFKANNFFIQEKLDSADIQIKKAIQSDSTNMDFLFLQIRIFSSQFKSKESLELSNYILSITSDAETLIKCYRGVADTYAKLKNDPLALEYDKKALTLNEKISDPSDLLTGIINMDVGACYIRLKSFKNALLYLNKADSIFKNNPSASAQEFCTLFNNFGVLYKNTWEYNASVRYYKKAIELAKIEYGENSTAISIFYENIGVSYGELKNYDSSLLYLNKAIKIQETLYGLIHPITAGTYGNFGRVYFLQKEYNLAIRYFEKEKSIYEKVLGKDNNLIGTFHNNMGLIYYFQGLIKKAIIEHTISLNKYRKHFGETSVQSANAYANLGKAYEADKNDTKTVYCYKKALEIFAINGLAFPLTNEFERKISILSKKKL